MFAHRIAGQARPSLAKGVIVKIALALRKAGLNSDMLHSFGFASIVAAVSLWAKSAAQSDRHKKARAERLAIFIGLWPPTFFLLGKVLQDLEAAPEEQAQRGRAAKGEGIEEGLRAA